MNTSGAFFGYCETLGDKDVDAPSTAEHAKAIQLENSTSRFVCFATGGHELVFATNETDRVGLAFLGELYNAEALREKLGLPPDRPLANILLTAFERWSMKTLERLDGIFALAYWRDGTLHLYRDGSAARNLYHAEICNGKIAFSSDLDRLLELPGVERRINRRSLHEYLRLLDISAPNTIYEGICALEAGHTLSWKQGRQQIRPVATQLESEPPPSDIKVAIDLLQGLLEQSINSRLCDLENPGVFLSGGVDSSLTCAIAKRLFPALTAITVSFRGTSFDETPVARKVAQHLGIQHEVLNFDQHQFLMAFEAFNRQAEQPCADPAAPPTLLGFESCRARFDGVLESSGADETVGLMPPRHVRIAVGYAATLPGPMRRTLMAAIKWIPTARNYRPILDFEHPSELMMRWDGFTRREIEAFCGEPVSFEHTTFLKTFNQFARNAHFERFSALEDAMPNDRVHQAAHMTGLSVRFPYYAADVQNFIRTLPIAHRYQPGKPKRILRELLARHVPPSIWDAPKHGFDFPLQTFLEDENFALVREYLDATRWHRLGLLDAALVAAYGKRFIAGEHQLLFRVWALIVLASWLEGHERLR